jgi:DNA-binding NarL/FixJ family response regulator
MIPIRLLCVDDSDDVGRAICRAARYEQGIEAVGSLTHCEGLADAIERLRPDVVLLDLSMPGEAPLEHIPRIAAKSPQTRVILFSGYDDEATRQRAREAGASGFISKDAELTDVFGAVRAAAAGDAT